MTDEPRRAPASYALHDAAGALAGQGDGLALIGDDALTIGPVSAAFLDADALRAADYRIELDLWPGGRLALSGLGRRFDTFSLELRRARDRARVAGLLAHAPERPEPFECALLETDAARPAECLVYSTHLTLVPADVDPFQVPLGALRAVDARDDPPAVVLVTAEGRLVVGRLARRRDRFLAAVREARAAQAALLDDYARQPGFADGAGLPRSAIRDFDDLLERCAAADRLGGAGTLLATARGGEPRLGFVRLLDPDADGLGARDPLPTGWAAFLLVPAGPLTALEIVAGPAAATYVFAADVEAVNRDLQLLHFRRAALALTGEAAVIAPGNPHRLALRRLAPLARLRAATRARIAHADGWSDALAKALAPG